MSLTRTCRFKVETSWQELVNRRIHAIEITLKEISFLNQGGFLIARGTFKREIIYVEFDGRFRKVDDKVQFEVVVGKALPEPLPLFKAELKQDYYIYQPRQIGDNQAVLEQAFLLVVEEIHPEPSQDKLKTLCLDEVVERKASTQMIRIPVAVEREVVQFLGFTGNLVFDPPADQVINCRVMGELRFTAADGSPVHVPLDYPAGWLVDSVGQACKSFTHCRLSGKITDAAWIKTWKHQGELELKIDYTCLFLQAKPVVCVLPPDGEHQLPSKVHSVKAMVLLLEKEHRASKTYGFPWNGGKLTEVRVETVGRNDRLTKKGVLLESRLKIEAYYLADDGVEAFHQWEVGFFELVGEWPFFEKPDDLRLDADLRFEPVVFSQDGQEVQLNVTAVYQLKVFQWRTVTVWGDETDGKTVLAKMLAARKKFAVMRETTMVLKRKPLRIQEIQSRFGRLSCLPKPGWMRIEGELLISVRYLHISGKTYEEQLNVGINESFIWNELTENHHHIELQPVIEFTAYEQNGTTINYRYLVRYETGIYLERELKIKALPEFVPIDDAGAMPGEGRESWEYGEAKDELTVAIEKEVPLKLGFPKEIAGNKTHIVHFDYRDAQNAILAEGVLETDLEYWDEDGFLRQERVDIPFWKFVQCHSKVPAISPGDSFVPEITRISLVPVNAWSWQKGMVRVSAELTLRRNRGVKT